MLTDTELRKLRPKEKTFKVADRDGMYVTVSTAGTKSFRYDYRLNGRRDTLTIALTFGRWATRYFEFKSDGAERLADSTLSLRRSIYS